GAGGIGEDVPAARAAMERVREERGRGWLQNEVVQAGLLGREHPSLDDEPRGLVDEEERRVLVEDPQAGRTNAPHHRADGPARETPSSPAHSPRTGSRAPAPWR